MIDTIKVGIPLTQIQHRKISAVVSKLDRWQWVQVNHQLGEMRFCRSSGLVRTDSHSYHRELRWDIDQNWSESSKLYLEFSIPKYWYGHNIRLLYGYLDALQELKSRLDQQFELKGKNKLAEPALWQLYRLDICYAWQFPSQNTAQEYLDSLKHLHYPKKKPAIYPTSIMFAGATYSLKFYLKYPEFRAHDLKELVKAKASLEWVNWLESIADGVLRYEVTLRRQYLKKYGFNTVDNLLHPKQEIIWDESLSSSPDFVPEIALSICLRYFRKDSSLSAQQVIDAGLPQTPITDGMNLTAPEGVYIVGNQLYHHAGGGLTFSVQDPLIRLLQGFIDRFLGSEVKMQEANQVKAKLLEFYKPVKAARLVSLWLYVQRFGTAEAKATFGRDSFDRSRRDLRAAGISMIEAQQLRTEIDSEFLRNMALTVPSLHAVNQVDDFRGKENVLNFVPRTSGSF